MRVYVGNIPFTTTEEELRGVFGGFGTVLEVSIVRDRQTDRSRGFAFVELAEDAAGDKAIAALHDSEYGGRRMIVSLAHERARRETRDYTQRRGRSGGDRERGYREAWRD